MGSPHRKKGTSFKNGTRKKGEWGFGKDKIIFWVACLSLYQNDKERKDRMVNFMKIACKFPNVRFLQRISWACFLETEELGP